MEITGESKQIVIYLCPQCRGVMRVMPNLDVEDMARLNFCTCQVYKVKEVDSDYNIRETNAGLGGNF